MSVYGTRANLQPVHYYGQHDDCIATTPHWHDRRYRRGEWSATMYEGWADALRSPRNELGKLALPKGLMERAVEAAWEGATSWVGNPADGIEQHNLADLADGICDFLAAPRQPLTTEMAEYLTVEAASDTFRCGQCGDDLLPSEIEGHLASEGRSLA